MVGALQEFDFENLAFLHDIDRTAPVSLSRRPYRFTDLVQAHAFAAVAVVFEPGTGLQINHDTVRVCVHRLRLAIANCLMHNTNFVVLEDQFIDMRCDH